MRANEGNVVGSRPVARNVGRNLPQGGPMALQLSARKWSITECFSKSTSCVAFGLVMSQFEPSQSSHHPVASPSLSGLVRASH